MKFSLNVSDTYVRRARLQPAVIVALPLALAVLAIWPTSIASWGTLWSLLLWGGGTALAAQIGRDCGKRKEQGLYRAWNGKPTTRLLRHRDAPNPVLLERRHRKLQTLVKGVQMPTVEAERADPKSADQIYEVCTEFLRQKTRDKDRFALIFEENCNYGFRRNLWGMKPYGLATAILATAVIAIRLILGFGNAPPPFTLACGGVCIVLLLGWTNWFTPSWVKLAADAYAERLLAACEERL